MFGDPDGVGWYAPIYGQVLPSPTIRLSKEAPLPFSMITMFAGPDVAEDQIDTVAADDHGAATVRVTYMGRHHLGVFGTTAAQPQRPAVQQRAFKGSSFSTDAEAALLVLSEDGDAVELHLVGAKHAAWSGNPRFRLDFDVATDLHLDAAALRQSAS